MANLRKRGLLLLLTALVGLGLCISALTIRRWIGRPELRRAHVLLSSEVGSADEMRAACPIPLPASASNLEYAVWSFGDVTQSWIRFDAPVKDCLAHAESLVQPFRSRDGFTVTATPTPEDTGVLCVLDPTEVDLCWFEDCRSADGPVFRVAGGRAPVIWVDTNRGTFYCEVKNECHSLSPP